MNYKSCFDIIGPIMIGPSVQQFSNWLSGKKVIRRNARKIVIKYYESFADTHKDMELILQLLAEFLD